MYNNFPMMNNPYQQRLASYETTSVIRVNGFNGANSYNLAPNSSVLLLDETAPIVYLKTTDGAGYGTVTAYDIAPHKDPVTVSMEDRLGSIETKLQLLEERLNEQSNSTTSTKSKQSNHAQSTDAV